MGTSGFSTSSRGRRLALGAAAVVAVGSVSAYASTIGAQTSSDPIRLEIVSLDDSGSVQDLPGDVIPAISDTGAVVVYETRSGASNGSVDDRRVWIRDRDGGTSRPVAEVGSTAPGISGNGCVAAYTVIGVDVVRLTVVDRCVTPTLPTGSVLDTVLRSDVSVAGSLEVSAPALSFDGSTVVWSTGQEIRRYARTTSGGAFGQPITFDVVAGGRAGFVTGDRVDVSADGRDVVFVAGDGTAPYAPSPANVYVWTAPTSQVDSVPELLSTALPGGPDAGGSGSPTISADGTFVVFESAVFESAVPGSSPVITAFVVGVDRTARTAQILLQDATFPAVSADGNHIVYQRGDALRVLSSGAAPAAGVATDALADARPTGPAAISQFGRWLVFASAADLAPDRVDPPRPVGAPSIWAADRSSSNGGVVDTTTTTTTTSPAVPSTTPPPSVTTPPGATSTVPEVASSPTIPATTLFPSVIVPRFPTVGSGFPSVAVPAPPPRPVAPSRSATPGVGSDLGVGASASTSSAVFGPTVVAAGRRVQPVTLTNTTGAAVQISSASIDVPDVFAIISDGCTGTTLAPGASCVVEVQFAPITVGPANGFVVFRLSDGSIVTASLFGDGAPGPTLDLVPAVAGAGQTVTVFGAGFPPGSTVELSQPGTAEAAPVVVDGDGTFAHVVVVLPNTSSGPAVLAVAGQPDLFDDVAAELLVSSRGAASGDTAVRSGPSRPLGR